MGFFNWIRGAVKSAVLAGFQDAVTELDESKGTVDQTVLVLEYRPNEELPPVRSGNGRVKSLAK